MADTGGEQPQPQPPAEKQPDWPPKGVDSDTVRKIINKFEKSDATPPAEPPKPAG